MNEPKAVHTCDTCVDHATGAACHTCNDFSMWIPRLAHVVSPPDSAFPPPPAAERKADPLQVQEGGSHYKDLKIQPIEYIHANGLDFLDGNVVKYVTRHKAKGGAADVRKIIHYCQLILKLKYGEEA